MKLINSENPWPSRLLALLFSIILFTFVQTEMNSRTSTTSPTNGASITSVEVLTDVPINIEMDTDQYFVTGLPETATVRLEGPQAILTQTLGSRNFEITTPDLNELGPGQHTIELEARRLSDSLSYSIMPATVDIVIEEKAVIQHDVSVEFSSTSLASGYTARTPIVSPESVRISGAKSVVEEINEVSIIVLPDGNNITEDIEMTLPVLVFNSNGELLNVNVEPSQVSVTVPVEGTTKTVPIVLRKIGEENPNYSYELELSEGVSPNVTVSGREELLNSLENLPVEVDISGVTESTTRQVRLTGPSGLQIIEPEIIEVIIRVSPNQEENASETEASNNDDTTDVSEDETEDTSDESGENETTDTSEDTDN